MSYFALRKTFCASCLGLFALSSCLHAADPAGAHTTAVLSTRTAFNDLAAFDSARLVDQNGRRVTAARLAGKLVILNFIFTRCSTSCPVQTAQLASLLQELPASLRQRVQVISVSVDPANDTPATMRHYAEEQHADTHAWFFVTGAPGEVAHVTKAFDVFAATAADPSAGRHTTDIRLFDRHGHFLQRYAGVPVDKPRLAAELKALSDEL